MNPTHSTLFGEIQELVPITIGSTTYRVPKGLELLRCYQYLGFEIEAEGFCWNGNCQNCAINLVGSSEKALSCQTVADAGMKIETLPKGITVPPQEKL